MYNPEICRICLVEVFLTFPFYQQIPYSFPAGCLQISEHKDGSSISFAASQLVPYLHHPMALTVRDSPGACTWCFVDVHILLLVAVGAAQGLGAWFIGEKAFPPNAGVVPVLSWPKQLEEKNEMVKLLLHAVGAMFD